MRPFRTIPLALAVMLVAGAALAASETSVSGKVDAIFGRQVVVATEGGGKVLVDVGRPLQPPLSVGETLRVSGRAEGNRLEAGNLTRADGSSVVLHGREHDDDEADEQGD